MFYASPFYRCVHQVYIIILFRKYKLKNRKMLQTIERFAGKNCGLSVKNELSARAQNCRAVRFFYIFTAGILYLVEVRGRSLLPPSDLVPRCFK